MKIPITKPWLEKEEAEKVYETVLSGWVTQGPRVEEFEKITANYCGAKHAIAVSSCTAAIELSLIVAGIQKGDEVIVPSMSFIASANSIVNVGGTPVFAEVNQDFNLNIDDVQKRITPKTKAILLVHQLGLPADIDAFAVLCKEQGIELIEDAACAIGSKYKGKKIGGHSRFVCFSYHPRKIITTGDGGMILTDDDTVARKLRLLRQHGMSINDRLRHDSKSLLTEEYLLIGRNNRMTDIQAAVGVRQMERLDEIVALRRSIAEKYNEAFKNIEGIILPQFDEDYYSNFQSYSVLLENVVDRDKLIQELLDNGISTRRGVMCAHRETAYIEYFGSMQSLPFSEYYSDKSIILPLYPTMKPEETDYVIEHLINALQG